MRRIMLLDDEENILKALNRVLRRNNECELESYSNGADALRRAQSTNFDLFISDFRMPEMDGVQFLSAVKEIQPESMRIILSGFTDLGALMRAINEAEIFRFISKPWNDEDVIAAVGQALKLRDMQVENRRLADEVRSQRKLLVRHERILENLEKESPGITRVNWDEDGYILLDESNDEGKI